MSFFHKQNVTKCLGHHYAIWTSDSNFLLAQKKKFRASLSPHFRHWNLVSLQWGKTPAKGASFDYEVQIKYNICTENGCK